MGNIEHRNQLLIDPENWITGMIFCACLIVMSGAGWWLYGLAFLDSIKFLAAVFLLFFVPGTLLVRLTSLRHATGLTGPVVALASGTMIVPVLYKFLRYLDGPIELAFVFFGMCAAVSLYLFLRERRFEAGTARWERADWVGLLALFALISVLLHFSHFSDVLLEPDGFQFRASDMTESVFHLGFINALADTYPPQALYASGEVDFSGYHLNMHLQTELLARLSGLETLHLVIFYIPLLYFALFVLLPYVFVRESGGTILTALICSALLFGADLSFIPSTTLDLRPGFAWTVFFQSTIWSLFTLNGYLPGLLALFLCIFYLRDYFKEDNHGDLVLFALVAYASFGFKSSMGLHIGAAALATGLLMFFQDTYRRQAWPLIVASAGVLSAILVEIVFLRSAAGATHVALDPLNSFHDSLKNLGMSGIKVDWYIPMLLLVLLGGLGARVIGLFYLFNRLRRKAQGIWILVFIGLFYLIGYLVSEMFYMGTPEGRNNSGWFYLQSLMAVWFLLFLFLVDIQTRKKAYLISVIAIVLISAPSTLQFLHIRASDKFIQYGPAEIEMIEHMRDIDPDSVFLHPLNLDRPSLASNFAGRVSVLSVWVSFVSEAHKLSERANNIVLFFGGNTSEEQRLQVLDKYQVDYIYGPAAKLKFMENLPGVDLELRSGQLVLYRVLKG
jgi:hypothetical protein